MGLEISFMELCSSDTEQWFKVTNDLGDDTASLIGLEYEVKGQGKEKCPLCGIFIGEDPCISLYAEIIHVSCLNCMDCVKNKPANELIYRNGRYYDSVCFERRFGVVDSQSYLSKMDMAHNWTTGTLNYTNLNCSHCGTVLRDLPSKCIECSFICHSECKSKVTPNCIFKAELERTRKALLSLITPKRGPKKKK